MSASIPGIEERRPEGRRLHLGSRSADLKVGRLYLGSRKASAPINEQRLEIINIRPRVRLFAPRGRQPRSNRVLEDVPCDRFARFVITQNPVVVSALPERLFRLLLIRESRHLFETPHECLKIRAL